ncbi:serine hydrolase domain-containing protein [Anaerocolumna sp. MB42-C2]|uniref:serine hydrolase domain-containing protein n=1 Tax=Anaerocolumna sp. MB42-C2 TaxID=3070997 RepID=UPI0027DF6AD2|nr:serine hydrolase [Anaerocolumna sp. MB42-C2]WMJ88986.1 serine hydrolase [Anaerocolumna sp. MB42-C2]
MNGFQFNISTPEQQGVKSEAIIDFLDAVSQCRTLDMDQDFHSVMIMRHGAVIAEGWWEPYAKEMPHMLFSLSKSFTSTAIGLAVSEGLLTVDDLVTDYFKKECPDPTGYLAEMRIKHLLSMSTGHVVDTMEFLQESEDGNWVKAFLNVPVEKEPGTHFLYNTGATYMLSVIIQRVTGVKLIDYLRPRLFEPLRIKEPKWEECPMGYNTGGFGLSIRTEDIAKFGQLYLNQGSLNGVQILPKEWIAEATCSHISNGNDSNSDWCQGYGYQFWRCRFNIYRGDGAFGQYCIVMPDYDMVVAITSGLKDMQIPLNLLWDHLLPGICDAKLPESAVSQELMNKLNTLKVLLPKGDKISEMAEEIAGKCFTLDDNEDHIESISFAFDEDVIHLHITARGKKQTLQAGIGTWTAGYLECFDRKMPARLTGIWLNNTTLLIQCRLVETPFAKQFRFTFSKEGLIVESKGNVGFEEPGWNKTLGK